jgi:hypothetical protein
MTAAPQVLDQLPHARGVLVTAGARGSAYAFRPANGKTPLTGRVPVLKVRRCRLNPQTLGIMLLVRVPTPSCGPIHGSTILLQRQLAPISGW